jgi:hypothetical protein
MKVMQLTDRIIFVDDIVSTYEEYKCGEYTNYTAYYIETKNKRISVKESDYKKVKEYLLSLNEPINEDTPKEDISNLKWGEYVIKEDVKKCSEEDLRTYISLIMENQNKIIDKVNGE